MNLSGTFFSDAETTLLRRGKKFAMNPFMKRSNDHTLLLADLGAGLHSDTRLNSSRFSQLISDALNQACRPSSPEYSAFASIQKKLKENNLVLVKADTGETLVITSIQEYEKRVFEFLE